MNITYPNAIPNAWPDVLHVDAYPTFSLQAQKKKKKLYNLLTK